MDLKEENNKFLQLNNKLEIDEFCYNNLKCVLVILMKNDRPSIKAMHALENIKEEKYQNINYGLIKVSNPLVHKKLRHLGIEQIPTFISFYKGIEFNRYSGSLIDSINSIFEDIDNQGFVSFK